MDLARALSKEQLEAATRLSAPVCILAGAGSGKTRVITHRIAWLLEDKRVAPESVLAVTFTNKAAGEMRHRVEALVPGRAWQLQLGTFHGLAARLLRRYGRIVDVDPGFVIYDADDAHRLLQRIVEGDLNLAKDTARPIGSMIDSWQSEGLLPDDVPTGSELLFEHALATYRLYLQRLQEMGAVDFGGLLLKLRALVMSADGAGLRRRIRHVLVDEYQDVSQVQADIVLAFAREAETVAVVGDDDQAIYGWRGASADNLKKFLTALPGAELLKLEENYRSTPSILAAANGIIAHNEVRLGKTLRVAHADTVDAGRRVRVVKGVDDISEARRVVNLALEHVASGTSLDEIAVLYRTNAYSRLFEDELRKSSLPYRVVGGVRFYDRKEVKDVLATLRAALSERSDVDFLRFLSAVPRGVGTSTLEKVTSAARKYGRPLQLAFQDASLLAEAGLSERAQKKCQDVARAVRELADKIGRPGPGQGSWQQGLFSSTRPLGAKDAVALAIESSGVAERLEAESSIEAEGRLENLQELLNASASFQESARNGGEQDDVMAFLESAALLGSGEEAVDHSGRGKLTLMTLHAAKGLEFEVVFLAGLEEHGFPHSRAIGEDADLEELEEERRLAYVGITRARRRLVLSFAEWRMVQGQRKRRDPSRFLYEIPRDVLEGDVPSRHRVPTMDLWRRPRTVSAASDEFPEYVDGADDVGADPMLPGPRVVYDDDVGQPSPRRLRPPPMDADSVVEPVTRRFVLGVRSDGGRSESVRSEPPAAADVEEAAANDDAISAGMRVFHRLFGEGTVVGMRGAGRSAAALVRFDEERQPRVIIVRHLKTAPSTG